MRRRTHRHPAIETAVFAAALLLAVFIGRELWRRRVPAPASLPPATPSSGPVSLNPSRPPRPGTKVVPATEVAVTAVPPVRLTRIQRRRPKQPVVPAPK